MISRRTLLKASVAIAAGGPSMAAFAQNAAPPDTIFYSSGDLRIEAYFFKPAAARFPLLVYNHGSRIPGQERQEVPFRYVGQLFANAGYGVLVPERRGYGKSEGITWPEAVRGDVGARFVGRLQEEAGDVIAAGEFAATLPGVDKARIGVIGWSLGGIVSAFAASRSSAFKILIDQAGGALSWNGSAALRQAMTDAIKKVKAPILFMDCQNDATTDAVTVLAKAIPASGPPHELKIYPPFFPKTNPANEPPGHLIFGMEGLDLWKDDSLAFTGRYLGPPGKA